MIFLLIIALVCFQVPFYNTLSVGDVALVIFNMCYILKYKKTHKIIFNNERLLLLFLLWATLSILFVDDYNFTIFINRFFRLIMVSLSYFFIQSYFYMRPIKRKKLFHYVIILNYAIIVLILIEFISIYLGDKIDLRITYRDFDLSSNRIRSVFTEQSILSIFLVFLSILITKFAKESKNLKFYKNLIIVNMILILLTYSIIGLIGIIIITFFLFEKSNKPLLAASALLLILFQLNLGFTDRVNGIIDSNDNSANHRVIGTWMASYYLTDNIYFGNGLGQESQLKHKKYELDNFSKFNPKLNNALAVFYYECGLIGLMLVLMFISSNFYSNKYFVFFALFFCFSHGSYFYTLFWVGLALLKINYNFNEKKLYEKETKSIAVLQ